MQPAEFPSEIGNMNTNEIESSFEWCFSCRFIETRTNLFCSTLKHDRHQCCCNGDQRQQVASSDADYLADLSPSPETENDSTLPALDLPHLDRPIKIKGVYDTCINWLQLLLFYLIVVSGGASTSGRIIHHVNTFEDVEDSVTEEKIDDGKTSVSKKFKQQKKKKKKNKKKLEESTYIITKVPKKKVKL